MNDHHTTNMPLALGKHWIQFTGDRSHQPIFNKGNKMSDYRDINEDIDKARDKRIEEGRTTPSDYEAHDTTKPKTARRDNTGKAKLGYFARSFSMMQEAIARVKEFGANKYDDGNWRLGGKPDEEYLDSFARHLDLFLSGEVYDQDSGCHHLGHMVWNLSAMYELNYKDVPVIDETIFRERMAYWQAKREGAPDVPGWIEMARPYNLTDLVKQNELSAMPPVLDPTKTGGIPEDDYHTPDFSVVNVFKKLPDDRDSPKPNEGTK